MKEKNSEPLSYTLEGVEKESLTSLPRRAMRKALRQRMRGASEAMPGLERDPYYTFLLYASTIWAFDKLKVSMGNRIRASIVNSKISKHSLFPEIQRLRRLENLGTEDEVTANKTAIAKLIKKALSECCKLPEDEVEDMITAQAGTESKSSLQIQPFDIAEEVMMKWLENYLQGQPIYVNYLAKIDGLGIKTSVKLMAVLKTLVNDPTKFPTPSALWHYCGLQVEADGFAEKKKENKRLNSNPKAKSLLVGVMGENFVKQRSQYRVIYDERKAKTLITHPEWHNRNPDGSKNTGKNMNPKHAERDAIRVMMKRFLCELWVATYRSKGLEPPCNPYILNDPNHHRDPQIVEYGPVD